MLRVLAVGGLLALTVAGCVTAGAQGPIDKERNLWCADHPEQIAHVYHTSVIWLDDWREDVRDAHNFRSRTEVNQDLRDYGYFEDLLGRVDDHDLQTAVMTVRDVAPRTYLRLCQEAWTRATMPGLLVGPSPSHS